MAEYIDREAVLRYLKECGECKLISIIVRDIEDMPYFVKGELKMPNDVANNMADTIHFLEEENASIMKSLTDLQLAYNEQMIELREAKRLLKLAVEDLHYLECHTVDEEGSCLISNRGEKINCFECPFNNNGRVDEKCIWNHEAEAEKLLKQ